MGFRISRNIDAQVVQSSLNRHEGTLATSIERLSSGLRINQAADDAATLTISEKFRSQVAGLNRAINNAQDGISLLQTAEGSLNENSSMLNRLRELSIQAQSDSLTTSDRIEIQNEVDGLISEIDRISKSTEFNTRSLLDGSASARVSTDSSSASAFQTGENLRSGAYDVSVQRTAHGDKQVQTSAIMTKINGDVATADTRFHELESMYDAHGNFLLENPEELNLRGRGNRASVRINANMTLDEFAREVELKVRSSAEEKGLDLGGSSYDFLSGTSQFEYVAGLEGADGNLSFAGHDKLINALGMATIQESTDSGFLVTAVEQGVLDPEVFRGSTTSTRASGIIDGLDLEFDLTSEARIDGSVASFTAVEIGAADVVFTLHDTNAQFNGQGAGFISAPVTVTLTASTTYQGASIVNIINTAVANANNPSSAYTRSTTSSSYSTPALTASFSERNLTLRSTDTGTSGEVSIVSNAAAMTDLGLPSGLVTGNGGTGGDLVGSAVISGGITVAGGGVLRISLVDGDFRTAPSSSANDISFNRGVVLSAASIVTEFNNYFTANSLTATAVIGGGGELQLNNTETGSDSQLRIISFGAASLADLGFANGQTATGSGGNFATVAGNTNPANYAEPGFELDGFMSFRVGDQSGTITETITFGLGGVAPTGETFTLSTNQITSILDNSGLRATGVDFDFDGDGNLNFFSRKPGTNNKITLFADATSQALGIDAFGIDFSSEARGSDRANFSIHVTDSSLRFQIGANKGESMQFRIADAGSRALGVERLDLTTIDAATRALKDIDEAVGRISSERSRLGSLQNRMESNMNSLHQSHLDHSDTLSRIRDADLAKENVDHLKSLILNGTAMAQLAQTRGITSDAVSLLL
jgi:flagellin